MRNIGLTALLIAITLLNSSTTFIEPTSVDQPTDFKVDVVVIDAGHGGHDNGTHGKLLREKDIALRIALKVGNYIEKNVSVPNALTFALALA